MSLPRFGLQQLLKDGSQASQGLDEAVYQNINVSKELSEMIRTSLGPNGLNKMILNRVEKLFITKDAATIVEEAEVEHPAAMLIVEQAKNQSEEFGDGVNTVISFAGELLFRASELLALGLPIPDIIRGFEKSIEIFEEQLEKNVILHLNNEDFLNREKIRTILYSIASSKYEDYADLVTDLVSEAVVSVVKNSSSKSVNFNPDNVRVIKIAGQSIEQSSVMKGMIVQRQSDTRVKHLENPKIVVFSAAIEADSTETKSTILIETAQDLMNFSQKDEQILKDKIVALKEAGVDCVITGSTISESALQYLNENNMMAIKILSKFDLQRMARSVGAKVYSKFEASSSLAFGSVDKIETVEIGANFCLKFTSEKSPINTIIIRSSTINLGEEINRVIDSVISGFTSLIDCPFVVAGAGATELNIAKSIEEYGRTCTDLSSYSIKAFAEALLMIPRTLIETSGYDVDSVMTKMTAMHAAGDLYCGVDCSGVSEILPFEENPVYDLMHVKLWAIKHALQAAINILSVDGVIRARKAGGPAPR